MVVETADLRLQLSDLALDIIQIHLVRVDGDEIVLRLVIGERTLEFQLMSQSQELEMELLEFALQILCFDLAPECFFYPSQDGEVVILMTGVIGLTLDSGANQAQFLMERCDVARLMFGPPFALDQLFEFLAGRQIFPLQLADSFVRPGRMIRVEARRVWQRAEWGKPFVDEFL